MIEIHILYMSNLYNKRRGWLYNGRGKKTTIFSIYLVCYQWQKFTSFIWAICIITGGGNYTTGVVRRPPHYQDIMCVTNDRNSHHLYKQCKIKGVGHFTTGVVRRPTHFQDIKFVNHDRNWGSLWCRFGWLCVVVGGGQNTIGGQNTMIVYWTPVKILYNILTGGHFTTGSKYYTTPAQLVLCCIAVPTTPAQTVSWSIPILFYVLFKWGHFSREMHTTNKTLEINII